MFFYFIGSVLKFTSKPSILLHGGDKEGFLNIIVGNSESLESFTVYISNLLGCITATQVTPVVINITRNLDGLLEIYMISGHVNNIISIHHFYILRTYLGMVHPSTFEHSLFSFLCQMFRPWGCSTVTDG